MGEKRVCQVAADDQPRNDQGFHTRRDKRQVILGYQKDRFIFILDTLRLGTA